MADWQNPLTPFIWISCGVIVLLILIGFIILITLKYVRNIRSIEQDKAALAVSYQQELLSHSIDIQEAERSRIASDLHDDLIGQLHRIKIINSDAKLAEPLSESISSARRISHDLRPPMIGKLSLGTLLGDYLEPFKVNFTSFILDKDYSSIPLSEHIKLHLLRICQEVITNIIKHDEVSELHIYSRISESSAAVLIADNGRGVRTSDTVGLGLKNIEMRAQVIRAHYRFTPVEGKGTRFLIALNTKKDHEKD